MSEYRLYFQTNVFNSQYQIINKEKRNEILLFSFFAKKLKYLLKYWIEIMERFFFKHGITIVFKYIRFDGFYCVRICVCVIFVRNKRRPDCGAYRIMQRTQF